MKIIPSIASAPQLDLKCQLDRIKDVLMWRTEIFCLILRSA